MLVSKVTVFPKLRSKFLPSLIFVRSRFKRPDTPDPDPEIVAKTWPEWPHMEREYFAGEFDLERPKGRIYDKKPFKIELEAGKLYAWCSCGISRNQPFCDGSHKSMDTTRFVKTKMTKKFRPIRFKVEETKEYWLCNCKQTENSPYCDLTHRRQDIQDFIKS